MITLTIDGKEVAVEGWETILQAAEKAGIRIPTLCYNKRLNPFGACRMCLVEVEAMKGKLIPACSTPVTAGMVVNTHTPAVISARKMVLELLLLYHPMDCPVCDKGGECDLQDLVVEYGVSENRFRAERFHFPPDRQSPLIERNANRCILCGSCARICEEVVGVGELSFVGRGFQTKMTTDFDRALDCEFCGQCVDICPVGALLPKISKYKARPWQLKKIPTICSYCSTGCTITLGIKQNEIIRSVGNENIGLNTGNLCIKGRYGFEYVNSSERLTSPLVKKNGQLIPTSWKEALGWVAQRLNQIKEQHGGQSIAGLCSERITNEEAYLFQKFMRVVIGTNHIDHGGGYSYQGLVQGLKEALGYAASTNSISEIRKAEVLLVLRSNISETHPVIGYEVNVAVKRHEAKLIVADCRKVKLSYFPGLFLYHKPGTEVALINGMLHVILKEDLWDKSFVEAHTEGLSVLKKALRKYTPHYVSEVCGVPQEALIKAARTFAQAKRALIFISAGLGLPSTNVELARAALNLILLTGNLGRESAGIFLLPEKSNSQGLLDMGVTPQFLPGLQAVSDNQIRKKFEETWKASLPKEPGMNALQILENAERGKIKALYIVGENPVVTYPGQAQTIKALEKVDFLVVQDLFLTPTAQLADVVLPAVSFAEKEGTYTNAERRVQRLMPAILPHAEARSDLSIFTELSRQMGYLLTPITPSEVMEEIRQLVPMYRGIHYARLTNGGVQWPCPEPDHPGTPFLSESIFASKRIPFLPVEFEDPVEDGAKEYPFVLITGSTLFHSGSLSVKAPGLTMVAAENQVELNPQDAEKLAIVEGDLVRVISRYGEITIRAKITEKTNSGTIFIPYHFEQPCVNALTDKQLKFTRVKLEKV